MASYTKKDVLRINFLFAALSGCFWASNCTYFSFLLLYFKSNGYSDTMIGLMLTILAIVTVVMPSISGYLADFCIPIKWIVTACLFLSIPLGMLLPLTVDIMPLAFLSVLATGLVARSLGSVIDSWCIFIREKRSYLNYGITRGIGSLSFAFTALIFGDIFTNYGIDNMFLAHSVFAALAGISALCLDNIPVRGKQANIAQQPKRDSYFQTLSKLFQNKRYVILIICMFLASLTNIASYSFSSLLVLDMGGGSTEVGIVLFMMAASEAPVLFIFQRLARRFKFEKMLCFAFFFVILRTLCPVLSPTLGWVFFFQTFQAVSLGLYLPATLSYISKICDRSLTATAVTFAISFSEGFAGIIGNFMGGILSDAFGIRSVFYLYTCFGVVAFIIFTYTTFFSKNKPDLTT